MEWKPPAREVPWEVKSAGGGVWHIQSVRGDLIACDISFGAYADHIVKLHNDSLEVEKPKVFVVHYYSLSSPYPICQVGMGGSIWTRRNFVKDEAVCPNCAAVLAGTAVV